jgi:hypothetical protein
MTKVGPCEHETMKAAICTALQDRSTEPCLADDVLASGQIYLHLRQGTFTSVRGAPLRRAPMQAVVLRLGRLFDPHPTAISLGSLLRTMQENAVAPSTPLPACHY